MKTKFIMLCGLPASGKSTLGLDLADKYHAEIISSDNLRIELYGNINDQEHNSELFSTIHNRIIENIKNCHNVIFDATNISYKRRRNLLKELCKYECNKVCYLLATPYKDCLLYNSIRERKVPESVIKKMYMNFYIPEKYEGWDEIYIKWNCDVNQFNPHDLFSVLNFISQDNPHHTLTIGMHCLKCMRLCAEVTDNEDILWAAGFHDIGKLFTKVFYNRKGEVSDIAHYYQHHLVSAYDSLFYLKNRQCSDEDILNICAYIQWHMQPFFIKTEKAYNRFIRLVGQEFYDNLLIIHKADMEAK